jgi:hypothetical protein
MTFSRIGFLIALIAALSAGGNARADNLFGIGDLIIPIDTDIPTTYGLNSFPGNENPPKLFDGDAGSKYLNFGEENSGFIVTPSGGPSVVQSVQFTSANDADERDPMTWVLYGTNAAITSANNSSGSLEPWVLIASGTTGLSTTRFSPATPVSFANSMGYASYRMLFPTVRNAPLSNSMQVAEVQLFANTDGTGPIVAPGSTAVGIDIAQIQSESPDTEGAGNLLDGDSGTKYLNFGRENSGFIITPSHFLPTVVESFTITTANDAEGRDPTSWALYGTNDLVTSYDHSRGINENWTLIDSGSIDLPLARFTAGAPVPVDGATPFVSYRLVFPTVRDGFENSMQIADIQFEGSVFVPEPSTVALAAMGLIGLGIARRRRK